MSKVYLIAGLGADPRIYKNIKLPGHQVIDVYYTAPAQHDTLSSYAQKLINHYIIEPDSIVIGNSLGGMVAIEIAKLITVKTLIVTSVIKTIDEKPWFFTLFKYLPIYKLIPGQVFTKMGFLIKPIFGQMTAEEAWLFNDMLKNSSPRFLKWAMYAVLHWDNQVVPPNLHHITGEKDDVFSSKRIKGATIIKGGSHIMIFDKADEINTLLAKII